TVARSMPGRVQRKVPNVLVRGLHADRGGDQAPPPGRGERYEPRCGPLHQCYPAPPARGSFRQGMWLAFSGCLSASAGSTSVAKEQVMANEQQDQTPHGEGRESDNQTMPGKSGDQRISGQGHQESGGQGKQKQNQNPRDQAKPGMQQRDPSSAGTKDDEQDDDKD